MTEINFIDIPCKKFFSYHTLIKLIVSFDFYRNGKKHVGTH